MNSFKLWVGAVCLSLYATGCATAYAPAASPRVTFTSAGVYKNGALVGSLAYGTPDAVKGNASAESEANLGENLAIGGWVLQIGALGGVTAGAVVASKNNANQDVVTGVLLGSLAVSLMGDAIWIAGNTHSINAINIYNDGLGSARSSSKPQTAALGPTAPAPPQASESEPHGRETNIE